MPADTKRGQAFASRGLVDILCSEAFWRGVAEGFSANRNLFAPHKCRWHEMNDLAHYDTILYSWNTVGECLNKSLASAVDIYGQEAETWEGRPSPEDEAAVSSEPSNGRQASRAS